MNLIPLFDTIDRCVPSRIRRSIPYLRATEVVAVILTDADGNAREWLELVACVAVILTFALWIVRRSLTLP